MGTHRWSRWVHEWRHRSHFRHSKLCNYVESSASADGDESHGACTESSECKHDMVTQAGSVSRQGLACLLSISCTNFPSLLYRHATSLAFITVSAPQGVFQGRSINA